MFNLHYFINCTTVLKLWNVLFLTMLDYSLSTDAVVLLSLVWSCSWNVCQISFLPSEVVRKGTFYHSDSTGATEKSLVPYAAVLLYPFYVYLTTPLATAEVGFTSSVNVVLFLQLSVWVQIQQFIIVRYAGLWFSANWS